MSVYATLNTVYPHIDLTCSCDSDNSIIKYMWVECGLTHIKQQLTELKIAMKVHKWIIMDTPRKGVVVVIKAVYSCIMQHV